MLNYLTQIFRNKSRWQAPLVPWGASDKAFNIVLIAFMTLLGFAFVYGLKSDTASLSDSTHSIWRLTITAGLVYGILLAVAFVLGPFKHREHTSVKMFAEERNITLIDEDVVKKSREEMIEKRGAMFPFLKKFINSEK